MSVRPRPSACSLICNGTVYPAAFFQFEMHAGTFQSFYSYAVAWRGGDLLITGGGSLSPLGTFFVLNFGGSRGSTTCCDIWMILSIFYSPVTETGVYLTKESSSLFFLAIEDRNAGSFLTFYIIPSCAAVCFKFASRSASEGRLKSTFWSSLCDLELFLRSFECFTSEYYFIF